MKRNRLISVILFVLGLGLVVLGTGLSDFSQTYLPFLFDGSYTKYPYMGQGEAIIIIGLVALSLAYILIIRGERSSERS